MSILGVMAKDARLLFDPATITRLRSAKGWSRTELAYRIGLSESAISLIESGKRQNPQTMKKIARAFRVPLARLMTAA